LLVAVALVNLVAVAVLVGIGLLLVVKFLGAELVLKQH
jgi:hypothetical protein